MREKIMRSFVIAFLFSFIIGFGVLYGVLYMTNLQQSWQELESLAAVLEEYPDSVMEDMGTFLKKSDIRLSLIEMDGTVVYDNTATSIMENHLDRKEVQEAIETGQGSSVRHSSTIGKDYLYVALKPANKEQILRLSVSFYGITESAFVLIPPFFFAFIVATFFVWVYSKQMSKSIMKPLVQITDAITKSQVENTDLVLERPSYPELNEITTALDHYSKETRSYLNQLEKDRIVRQEFFSNASHELKTPLTSIRGYSELLRTHTITDKEQIDHCLDCVLQESDHMTDLINSILMISKLESGENIVQNTHVDIPSLVNRVVDSLKVQAKEMRVTVNIDCDEMTVYASQDHMKAIFYNLISNAIKYNKEGGQVFVSVHKEDATMHVIVRDTGVGISKEDQERVFQRFYRVDKQRSKQVAGTGLGLAIVKHVCLYYNGSVELTSKEDKGSRFDLYLPIVIKSRG